MDWIISEERFERDNIIGSGNKFMTGNGYMGCRGTMEEYGKSEYTGINLAGVYDRHGEQWRETVNAPNPLFTKLFVDGNEISLLSEKPSAHEQSLNIRMGLHKRKTQWELPCGKVTVSSDRFVSKASLHLMGMKYTVAFEKPCAAVIKTGIDTAVHDLNGPHFESCEKKRRDETLAVHAVTGENKTDVYVYEAVNLSFQAVGNAAEDADGIYHQICFEARPGINYTIFKYAGIYTSLDEDYREGGSYFAFLAERRKGYDACLSEHIKKWEDAWQISDVVIDGDPEAQLAVRYSIYQLLLIAPRHTSRTSIAARGLSGQTYKGAVFWDTEMFMLPFFIYTDKKTALNLIRYRVETLDGARKKAREYGYRGAFYAWESQEGGADACSDYNVTDVFTGRKMRTYFRDKQIHISADVAYAIYEAFEITGDDSILLSGGAEVILECARFYASYVYFKEEKDRYEVLDVIGPDEYHERVANNAFTNKMVSHTMKLAMKCADYLSRKHRAAWKGLVEKLGFEEDLRLIGKIAEKLYVPSPDGASGLIEQFDGYFKLEDCTVAQVRSRLLDEKEYWGGANGVAARTMVIKQADVVAMLALFRDEYDRGIKKANWEFYEKKTEHGSSLSACLYALVACDLPRTEWAYRYFMKTARVDLDGESKQFAGSIYIGGTHPAASGGAWMVAVLGFAGLHIENGKAVLSPRLPGRWRRLRFEFYFRGARYRAVIEQKEYKLWRV